MFVKYCGFTRKEDLDYAVELGIDAVGFIFYKGSQRYITPEKVREITVHVPPSVIKVGIFVGESADWVNAAAAKAGLDAVQLFADEILDPSFFNCDVFPVYRVEEVIELNKLKPTNGVFILDAMSVKGMGGTGESFEWSGLKDFDSIGRSIIAGGVSIENLPELLKNVQPYGIDLSSSIEVSPGIKSHQKMKEFKEKLEELIL